MESFAMYLLKSGIWVAVFWLVYSVFLRRETFYKFNRGFLLTGFLCSMVFPFFQYSYKVSLPKQMTMQAEYLSSEVVAETAGVSWSLILAGLYVLGIILLVLHYGIGFKKLSYWIRRRENNHSADVKIVEVSDAQTSFSFYKYVFINSSLATTEVERRLIIEHETAHVEQRHWLDLMIVQLFCILQWFNPFVWMYLKAIKQNHEFLADEAVLQKGNSPAMYHAALINYTLQSPVFVLANSFGYSNKFRRIRMMKKEVSHPAKRLFSLLIVPALAVFLWAFAKPEYVAKEYTMDYTIINTLSNDSIIVVAHGAKEEKTAPLSTRGTIRGISMRKGGEPLYILDGKEIESIDQITPDQIESISVLKDNSALTLYGEQAKNGVIVITSKRVNK